MTLNRTRHTGPGIVFEDGELLLFDAATALTPNYESNFSAHPTESGRSITSHIQLMPTVVSLTAHFTDTPLRANAEPAGDRALALYNRLLTARNNRELFTLITTRGTFPSMGIQHLDAPYTPATGQRVDVTVVLHEVVIVSPVQSVIIPARLLQRRRDPPVDPGKKPGQRDEDDPSNASLGKQITDTHLGGLDNVTRNARNFEREAIAALAGLLGGGG